MDALAADTAERLRGKHIRTLEVTGKLMDENRDLKARLEALGGATLTSLADEVSRLKDTLSAERRSRDAQVPVLCFRYRACRPGVECAEGMWGSGRLLARFQQGRGDWIAVTACNA